MNSRAVYRLCSIAWAVPPLLLSVWLNTGICRAQEEELGRAEIGVRFINGDRHASKFTEYRDIPVGLYLKNFRIDFNNLLDDRYFFRYRAREVREKDQSHLLSAGMTGKFQLLLRWDQIPHAFTNTARTVFLDSGGGIFTVPLIDRTSLQTSATNLNNVLEGAQPLNIRLRRATAGGAFSHTPTPNWSIELSYEREKQSGYRPFGTTLNGFSNNLEQQEPIDYRTQTAKASAGYVSSSNKWAFQVGYTGSVFENRVGALVWDNPFRLTDATGGGSRGRVDLYPDNSAHSLSVAGAINLPASTRFMGSLVRGWMTQNDAFLPFTINTAIPNIPALPASSLNGRKETLAMNYTIHSGAIPSLMLTARYRSYDYENETPSLVFPGYVSTDSTLGSTARRSLPYGFKRETAGLDGVWGASKLYSLKVGYEWERMDREHRDVERSVENAVGASFDLTPASWFTFRTSYRRSERTPEHYEANEEGFPNGEGAFALGQLEGLRKLDQAARSRDRAETLLQVDPTDRLSLSASFGTTQDDYHDSAYGLRKNINFNISFDASYALRPNLSIFGEYSRERYRYAMRSRQRNPPNATNPANDTSNNDWESNIRDLIDTWTAGLDGSFFFQRLNYEAFYSLSAANDFIHTSALGQPTIGGFLVTTARDYPNTNNRYHQLVASVRFRTTHSIYPKFEYRFEKYGGADFQVEPMVPNMSFLDSGTATSIYLGATVPRYRAHVLAFAMEYRF